MYQRAYDVNLSLNSKLKTVGLFPLNVQLQLTRYSKMLRLLLFKLSSLLCLLPHLLLLVFNLWAIQTRSVVTESGHRLGMILVHDLAG